MGNGCLNEKIENALSEREIEVTKAQMEQMLLLAKKQFRKSSRKKRMGFGELLLWQIRFIGIRIWGIEIVTAFFIVLVLRSLFMDPYFFTPRKLAFFLSCATVTASILLIPFLYRSVHFLMMEIESAAYYSIKRILVSRFFLFFGGEIVIAAAVCTIAYVRQFVDGTMLIYVLLPLLLTGDGILFFLQKASPEKLCLHYICYTGALLFLSFVGFYAAPGMFDGKLLYLPLGAGAALLSYFICQCTRLVKCAEEI